MRTRSASCALLVLLAAAPAHAATIRLEPAVVSIGADALTPVAVVVEGLGTGAPSVSTFDLDVEFDAGVLALESAVFGDPLLGDQLDLLGFGSLKAVAPVAGSVNLLQISFDLPDDLDTLQADSFVLATLTFRGVSPGVSPLSPVLHALGDADGAPLLADLVPATVTVVPSAVPEPATAILVLAGAAAGLRRARRSIADTLVPPAKKPRAPLPNRRR